MTCRPSQGFAKRTGLAELPHSVITCNNLLAQSQKRLFLCKETIPEVCPLCYHKECWDSRNDMIGSQQDLSQRHALLCFDPFGCLLAVAAGLSLLPLLWPAIVEGLRCQHSQSLCLRADPSDSCCTPLSLTAAAAPRQHGPLQVSAHHKGLCASNFTSHESWQLPNGTSMMLDPHLGQLLQPKGLGRMRQVVHFDIASSIGTLRVPLQGRGAL